MNEYQDKLARFVELAKEKKSLDSSIKEIDRELKPLEAELIEHFTEMGQQSAKVNGVTVYLHRQLWAGPAKLDNGESDYETTVTALLDAGLGDMVQTRFNTNTLSAWVREQECNEGTGEPVLPEALQGKITVSNVISLRTRQS